MNRCAIVAVVFSACVFVGSATAQQSMNAHRIGYLTISPRSAQTHLIEAFERGLAEHGYAVGRDLLIEYRFADGKPERLQGLAEELVRAKVELIVTGINPNIQAAQRATKVIPIVTAISYFPVEEGLVQSLARPGGNVTGLTSDAAEEVSRRLQLLRELAPRLSRVGVLTGVGEGYQELLLSKLQTAGRRLGMTILPPITIGRPRDVDQAFAEMERNKADGLIVLTGAAALTNRARIIELSAKLRLPAIWSDKIEVEDGALISYGVDVTDLFRRAADYVDRILKGARPADLPFEQPTRYLLAINLRTAKGLGITVPQTLLLQADRVVEQ
jgi:putative tryptophan/tyrosine transport system substrate-binding protein